jgi:hypothetical protein
MVPIVKTCKTTAAGVFRTYIYIEIGLKSPEFSGIVGQYQRYPVLNDISNLIQKLDNDESVQLPWETTIQDTITSPWGFLYQHPEVSSVPIAPALAFCASTNLRCAFTLLTLGMNLNIMLNTQHHYEQLFIE